MTIEEKKLSDLTPDPCNANAGTERGAYMLETSLRKYGAGRSILLDKHGRVIAGNKTLNEAAAIGLEDVIVIRTDGKRLVAVQRDDLDLADDLTGARGLAYADNRVGEVDLQWDPEAVLADLNAGVELGDFWRQDELDAIIQQVDVSGVEFREYDESIADEVEYITCPHCGEKFPK